MDAEELLSRCIDNVADKGNYIFLFRGNYDRDANVSMELGLAVIMDKPIYVIAPMTWKIPNNILRLSPKIELYDLNKPETVYEATKRLMAHILEMK